MLKTNDFLAGVTARLGNGHDVVTPPASDATYADRDVDVVLDVEWCRNPARRAENRVLMYGLRLDCGGKHVHLIVYPKGNDRRHRLKLSTLLGQLFARAIPETISNMPPDINLITHFGRGDLAACRDFPILKHQVDALGGTFATTRGSARLEVDLDPKCGLPEAALPRMPDRRRILVKDACERSVPVNVVFRDTSLLVVEDARRSLDAIGLMVGIPKVELPPEFDKSRMDLLVLKDKALAEKYLRADLAIPMLYFQRLRRLVRRLGLKDVPPTLGGTATALLSKVLKPLRDRDGAPVTLERIFATEARKSKVYSRSTGRYRTVTVRQSRLARTMFEDFMAEGYHGGRTETFETGPSPAGELLNDIDLRSAYPSAMIGIRLPDYDAAHMSTSVSDYTASTLGVAEVAFEAPPDLRFPVFAVRTDHGLVFPRRGTTVTTAPEIASARYLGVEVRILRGVIIPWADDSVRPYEAFCRTMIELRESMKENRIAADGTVQRVDTLESLVIKTITNSIYGKTAQAVRPRSVFDSRSGAERQLSPSAISKTLPSPPLPPGWLAPASPRCSTAFPTASASSTSRPTAS